jgi:hypothetical protein
VPWVPCGGCCSRNTDGARKTTDEQENADVQG